VLVVLLVEAHFLEEEVVKVSLLVAGALLLSRLELRVGMR